MEDEEKGLADALSIRSIDVEPTYYTFVLNRRSKNRKNIRSALITSDEKEKIPTYATTHIAGTLHCQSCQPDTIECVIASRTYSNGAKLEVNVKFVIIIYSLLGIGDAIGGYHQSIPAAKRVTIGIFITEAPGPFAGNANCDTQIAKKTNLPSFGSRMPLQYCSTAYQKRVTRQLFRFHFGLVVTIKYGRQ